MVVGDTNSLPIEVHTNKEDHFWINFHKKSLPFYVISFYHTMSEEYVFTFNRNSD